VRPSIRGGLSLSPRGKYAVPSIFKKRTARSEWLA
jgi:hypothetical protein